MIFELFISNRLSKSKLNKNYYSGPITSICTLAIAISMVIMIIAISSGIGLKNTIKNNVINVESHIQISSIKHKNETESIYITKETLNKIKKINTIDSIYPVVKKSAIISNNNNMEGVMLKGIDVTYKTENIKKSIVSGSYFNKNTNNELLISTKKADQLNLKSGDSCILYFLSKNNNIQKRKFIIIGTYKMANEILDEMYVLTKINSIQKINKWGEEDVTNYEITLDKNNNIQETVQNINLTLPYNLLAKSIEDRFPGIFNWINLFDKNISFILIIMSISITSFRRVVVLIVIVS